MADTSPAARLKKIDEERARLDHERAQLQQEMKGQALANAQSAVDNLNSLGFNYRLVDGTKGGIINRSSTGTSTRRSGIRDDVYRAVKAAGADGSTPAAIRNAIGIEDGDKSGAQSVSNALSALKKASKIGEKNGSYVAA